MLDDMFLVLIILRLMIFAEANNLDPSYCNRRFNVDCKIRKLKWFHNPRMGVCLRKLTCHSGFEYRADCARTCIISAKKKQNESAKILDLINRMLIKYRESEWKKKQKVTKPSKPVTTEIPPLPTTSMVTSSALLSVTIPETTSAGEDEPDLETTTPYPEDLTVDDTFEKYSNTTALTKRTTQMRTTTRSTTTTKKKIGKIVLGTVKVGLISKIIGWGKGKG
ncbi:uncharacterized protein LOC120443691 [Drosophila santomea]|uniref:uncharacterized protein LOC120443691 n=1 Tax=Drosophila santomea TaxID=129105 RepID=UPI001954B7D7|nr:uncharacterized protein LOC120443691 [Drosophila santomea]